MKVDMYTKTMLTVIAACLVWMCANAVTPAALAQTAPPPPTRVMIVDERGTPLNTPQGLRIDVGTQPVPVSVSQNVPVTITSIQRLGLWQPVIVDVMRAAPTQMPTP
jgi:hypothetical protein